MSLVVDGHWRRFTTGKEVSCRSGNAFLFVLSLSPGLVCVRCRDMFSYVCLCVTTLSDDVLRKSNVLLYINLLVSIIFLRDD